MPPVYLTGVELAVRHLPDEHNDDDLAFEVGKRRELDHGHYEVGFVHEGAFVAFAHVKGGRVFKQKRIVAERAAAEQEAKRQAALEAAAQELEAKAAAAAAPEQPQT